MSLVCQQPRLIELTREDLDQLAAYSYRLVVACSGGVDSVALVSSLSQWKTPLPRLELFVCHINFSLRGEAARADEEFVRDLAASYELPMISYHPYPRFQDLGLGKISFEQWARQVKLDCFRWLQWKGHAIALAHHFDDQCETILFRLARGSQPWNLMGLKRWHQGLFRPFLSIRKSRLREHVAQSQLGWVEDETNQDIRFARNRIRHRILPELDQLQPGARDHIVAVAQSCKDLKEALTISMGRWVSSGCLDLAGSPISSPAALQVALELLAGQDLSLTSKQLGSMAGSLADSVKTSQSFSLPAGTFYREHNLLTFFPHVHPSETETTTYHLLPHMTIEVTLSGLHHRRSIKMESTGGLELTLQPMGDFVSKSQQMRWWCSKSLAVLEKVSKKTPGYRKDKMSQKFRRARDRYDVFPQISKHLLFLCHGDVLMAAFSPSRMYLPVTAEKDVTKSSVSSSKQDELKFILAPEGALQVEGALLAEDSLLAEGSLSAEGSCTVRLSVRYF